MKNFHFFIWNLDGGGHSCSIRKLVSQFIFDVSSIKSYGGSGVANCSNAGL